MYKVISEAIELANGLKRACFKLDSGKIDIILCPPFTALCEVSEIISGTDIQLGAQDCFWQDEGAFTGEVSPRMLKDVGCAFVIIGHSERRQYFAETNESVNKKIKAALVSGLTPICCVGETLAEREKNLTFEVIDSHVKGALKDIDEAALLKIIFAYEPVWAIGTGKTATPQQAEEVHLYIRKLLEKLYNKGTADEIRIQYGGSVKPENIISLMQQPDVDGALVGGASLSVDAFSDIIKKASEVEK